MIAQFFLSALLTLVLIYAWSQYRRSQVIAMLSTGAAAAALYLVWMPSHATFLAERVGIGMRKGRTGAELLQLALERN